MPPRPLRTLSISVVACLAACSAAPRTPSRASTAAPAQTAAPAAPPPPPSASAPVVVTQTGSASDPTVLSAPATSALGAPSAGAVRVVVERYTEPCSSETAPPTFDVVASADAFVFRRRGAAPRVECSTRETGRFCGDAEGHMMDCPPERCRCSFSLETSIPAVRPGAYDVFVEQPAGPRVACGRVVVP